MLSYKKRPSKNKFSYTNLKTLFTWLHQYIINKIDPGTDLIILSN